METDKYYIPKELVLKMIDDLSLEEINALSSTNKDLSKMINDPKVLKRLSDRFHLPYVSSFTNLLYLSRLNLHKIVTLAALADDVDYIRYLLSAKRLHNDIFLHATETPYTLKYLLEHFKKISFYEGDKNKLIVHAIEHDSIESIKLILKYMRPMATGFAVAKWLTIPAMNGNLEMVKFLVEDYGRRPSLVESFKTAIEYDNLDIVKYLYTKQYGKKKADFSMYQYKDNPLTIAFKHGNIDIFDYLLSKSSKKPDKKSIEKWYTESVDEDDTDFAILIIDKFRDRIDLEKALKIAKKYDNKKVVKYLKSL